MGTWAQAAQANSDAEIPVFPSYSIPKALIFERFASAALNSDAAGWNTPTSRTGCPVSTPKGTMSSISKSIASPILTLWRQPVLDHLERRPLDAEHLADQGRDRLHRAALLSAEDRGELLHLLVVGAARR